MKKIDRLRQIVRRKGYQEIEGSLVDMQTANAILKVRDALKKENRQKYDRMIEKDMGKASRVAWRLVS